MTGQDLSDSALRCVVVSDGIRGHLHQARGVALWISRLCGASVMEIGVPGLKGLGRFLCLKMAARRLPSARPDEAHAWLVASGGAELFASLGDAGGPETLFLAAGSSAASYCLALARAKGSRSAVIMTPSVLGTAPFDFAVVPAHDGPIGSDRLFVTLGAPNHIYRPDLEEAASALARSFPPRSKRIVALLLGGSDGNYRIDAAWARERLAPVRAQAERLGADLYVTTSRRTGKGTDDALEALFADSPSLRMLLLASRDEANPVPAMLGLATHAICTDDSVSMISEAATAGFRVGLLRARRRGGVVPTLQEGVGRLVSSGFLPPSALSGLPRFDRFFRSLSERGSLVDLTAEDDLETFLASSSQKAEPLDEARRAAAWIVERWRG
ncbi:mitochondrial fission ELM1 family protein [Aminirod propionatiphilus]|uniref:Mitochondrial fission ELM1 family protein n=1 Tax=Aminirod propionatiphilus TaxID=3415223 RepID=A0ACD1DX81_9BACT|nr:mitochondrial fission ELM1 family protein [Synergistota bacterium]